MSLLDAIISSLAYGGAGVARINGKVCFVHGTAPGDRVLVKIVREKKGYLEAELAELRIPSPSRIEPRCPWFGICGGCSWQHLSYEAQLAAKEEILRGFLSRVDPGAEPLPMVASPLPFGYRNRIQLKVRKTEHGLAMGFYRKGSHFVVDIGDACPLASSHINAVLPAIREVLASFPARDRIPQVDAVHGDDGRVHLTFHALPGAVASLTHHLLEQSSLVPSALVAGLHIQSGRKETLQTLRGQDELSYSVADVTGRDISLSFACDGFSQVNSAVNRLLISRIAEVVTRWGRGGRLLDLYCGNGNLSLPLAPFFSSIDGIEGYGPSIASARNNARQNGIGNARFHVGPAEEFPRLCAVDDEVSLALIDPPREGARAVVEGLSPRMVPRIIYVSCDPSTLARDAAILCRAGYRLTSFGGFDMFPQTYHIETVATFESHP